jgi:hypothetical protein
MAVSCSATVSLQGGSVDQWDDEHAQRMNGCKQQTIYRLKQPQGISINKEWLW